MKFSRSCHYVLLLRCTHLVFFGSFMEPKYFGRVTRRRALRFIVKINRVWTSPKLYFYRQPGQLHIYLLFDPFSKIYKQRHTDDDDRGGVVESYLSQWPKSEKSRKPQILAQTRLIGKQIGLEATVYVLLRTVKLPVAFDHRTNFISGPKHQYSDALYKIKRTSGVSQYCLHSCNPIYPVTWTAKQAMSGYIDQDDLHLAGGMLEGSRRRCACLALVYLL
ncbi:uncharacterized protein F5147DRAFT_666490 [Suillus discolor]|uniref:Uncharacterized protein n=1 Tax=Suillus discolor TaxID=1912936 RepID=A0A9P7K0B1_9AGAM|nr:uncharacterized protein F5147DRAFT_666490 [Suillus discolor]KAG2118719.1 hypothetical protein F5147DRAFT_666490 [Suillus discolor]